MSVEARVNGIEGGIEGEWVVRCGLAEARVVELRGGSCSMGGEYGAVVMFMPGRVRVS